MRLELIVHRVDGLVWGDATALADGSLAIGRDALAAQLLADERLAGVDFALTRPGESCRVAPVFDVVEPRAKVDGGVDFPGALGPIRAAGQGSTRVLRGAAVVVLDPEGEPRGQNAVLDLSGPGAALSHYATTQNLVVTPRFAPDLDRPAQLAALRQLSLRAAVYLAQAVDAALDAAAEREVYALAPVADGSLPRVAYVYQLHSQQYPTLPGEPILYGDNVRHLLPTILHPNEVFDGAVVRNYRPFGLETYAIQNHAIVGELYRRHGRELDFAGVVATCAQNMLEERERAVTIGANLVAHVLRANGAVFSKAGGGAPHVDMAQVAHRLEGLGVRTVLLAWDASSAGSGDDGGALFNYADLDAIVNYGSNGFNFTLPPVERTLAGQPAMAEALAGALELPVLSICGSMDQTGAGRLTAATY